MKTRGVLSENMQCFGCLHISVFELYLSFGMKSNFPLPRVFHLCFFAYIPTPIDILGCNTVGYVGVSSGVGGVGKKSAYIFPVLR